MSRKTISNSSSVEPDAEPDSDFDEAPHLDHAFFEGARLRIGRRILREATGTYTQRGRPPLGSGPKIQQSLRLSPEVLEFFRGTGPGWQARIDEVLKRHVTMAKQIRREVAEAEAAESRVAEAQEGFRGEEGGGDPDRRKRAARPAKHKPAGKP